MVFVFDAANKEWLWFVSINRRSELTGELKGFLQPALLDAEIVIGKIANDTTNPTIVAYLNGLSGKNVQDVRDEVIESGAYDALYDEDTGLWTQGPDYFIDYLEMLKSKGQAYEQINSA